MAELLFLVLFVPGLYLAGLIFCRLADLAGNLWEKRHGS